jgi:hypothetical protein
MVLALVNITNSIHIYHSDWEQSSQCLSTCLCSRRDLGRMQTGREPRLPHSLYLVFVLEIIYFKLIVCGIHLHWDSLVLTATQCRRQIAQCTFSHFFDIGWWKVQDLAGICAVADLR